MKKNIEKEIFKTIRYFSFFSYPPTLEEIYTFLPVKTTKKELKNELDCFVKQKKLLTFNFKLLNKKVRYTLGEYSIKLKNYYKRYQISQKKLENWRFRVYLKFLSLFSSVKLVGLSGSIAMMNAKREDDIDLFIITAKNRLFTGRFIALLLAELLGIRRKRDDSHKWQVISYKKKNKDKVCLNLFFDESDLTVPQFKKSQYVGHEILQMKPLINKDAIYERFLEANKWVFKIFPNSKNYYRLRKDLNQYQKKSTNNLPRFLFDMVEFCLKKLQLNIIKKHQTNEIITLSQLWFHPEDFNKKLKI